MTDDEFKDLLIKQNQELIALNRQALDIVQVVLASHSVSSMEVTDYTTTDVYSSMEENELDRDNNELFDGEVVILEDLIEDAEKEFDNELDRE